MRVVLVGGGRALLIGHGEESAIWVIGEGRHLALGIQGGGRAVERVVDKLGDSAEGVGSEGIVGGDSPRVLYVATDDVPDDQKSELAPHKKSTYSMTSLTAAGSSRCCPHCSPAPHPAHHTGTG
jgi:hypothetical protein